MDNYYLWSFPGCPVKVRLCLSVIAQLQQRLESKDGVREEGLLLGGLAGDATLIEDCRPVRDDGFRDRTDALARLVTAAGQDRVAGYYRFEGPGPLRLAPDDFPLAKNLFAKPHQVILLIQRSAVGPSRAAFFFWDNGRINGDVCFLEFAFDKTAPRAGEICDREPGPAVAPPSGMPRAPRRRGRVLLMTT